MESRYYSFLVRLWAAENNADAIWHISLESSETGETRVFPNLDELIIFFEDLMRIRTALRGEDERKQGQ